METLCLPFYSKQQTPWNMMMNGNGINMNGINIKSEPQDVVMNDYQHQHQHANNMSSNYGNSLMANATTQQVNGHHNHNHSHNHGHNQSFNPNGLISLVHIQNLALKECAKEIDVACEALNISADPFNWSVKDVQNWLVWTQKQFNLQPFPLDYFAMDGMTLCSLNEADFKQRAPHCGDILYAQLDIWKTAVEFRPEETILEFSSLLNSWSTPLTSPTTSCASLSQASGCSSTCPSPDSQSMTSNGTNNHSHIDQSLLSPVSLNATLSLSPLSPEALSPLSVHSCGSSGSSGSSTIHSPKSASIESSCGGIVTSDYGSDGARSDDEISCYDGCDLGNVSQNSISNGTFTAGSPASHSESTSHSACSPASSNSMSGININHQHEQNGNSNSRSSNQMNTTGSSRSGSGSHIHLWQFLKELLAEPQLYGSCIRWLDRPKGIFKIEDSVRVARLWGKRKNRPAMNYDKLSRSIRQYYKKGIMKKTERSQRLVYQFCHPYCL